jgi:hypothetical protein
MHINNRFLKKNRRLSRRHAVGSGPAGITLLLVPTDGSQRGHDPTTRSVMKAHRRGCAGYADGLSRPMAHLVGTRGDGLCRRSRITACIC